MRFWYPSKFCAWGKCLTGLTLALALSGLSTNEHEGTFQGEGNVPKLDCGDGCTTLKLTKLIHCTLTLVNLMKCKFYLSEAIENIECECPGPRPLILVVIHLNRNSVEFIIIKYCKQMWYL